MNPKQIVSGPDDQHHDNGANVEHRISPNLADTLERWRRGVDDLRRHVWTVEPFVAPVESSIRLSRAEQDEARRLILGDDDTECPDSSYGTQRSRAIGTPTYCRRAYRRWVEDGDGLVAVWLLCRSRTCRDCRAALDAADAERVAHGLEGGAVWLSEIPADRWPTVSKRLHRHGAIGARIPSHKAHDRVLVVADEPASPDAMRITDPAALLTDLMSGRPTGHARRLTTFGDIPSRDDWTDRARNPQSDGRTDWMSELVQPGDVERVAAALGVPVEVTAATVRLRVGWDDWRAAAIRRWCKNPSGKQWSDMQMETLIREGVIPSDEPPDDAYEPGELVGGGIVGAAAVYDQLALTGMVGS